MSIRIRVYPQGMNRMGMGGMGGYGGLGGYGGFGANRFGGAVSAQKFYSTQLNNQQRLSSLQLGYERALWGERLEKVRLEERLKNPYAQVNPYGGASPYGSYGGINPYGGASPFGFGAAPVSNSWLGGSMLGQSGFGGSGFFGGLGLGGMF